MPMIPIVAVTLALRPRERAVVADALGTAARPVYFADLDDAVRAETLQIAAAILAHDTDKEVRPGQAARMQSARLIQFLSAGIDFIKFDELPTTIPAAGNGGAYSEPMAEHGLALILAASKRLLIEHAALARGEFHQHTRNRLLSGKICGIL